MLLLSPVVSLLVLGCCWVCWGHTTTTALLWVRGVVMYRSPSHCSVSAKCWDMPVSSHPELLFTAFPASAFQLAVKMGASYDLTTLGVRASENLDGIAGGV